MEKSAFFSSVRRILQQSRKLPEFQHVELYGVYSDFFPLLFIFFLLYRIVGFHMIHEGSDNSSCYPCHYPCQKQKNIYIRGGGIRNKRQISLIPIITINKGDISLKMHCKLYSCLSFKNPRLKHKF